MPPPFHDQAHQPQKPRFSDVRRGRGARGRSSPRVARRAVRPLCATAPIRAVGNTGTLGTESTLGTKNTTGTESTLGTGYAWAIAIRGVSAMKHIPKTAALSRFPALLLVPRV